MTAPSGAAPYHEQDLTADIGPTVTQYKQTLSPSTTIWTGDDITPMRRSL